MRAPWKWLAAGTAAAAVAPLVPNWAARVGLDVWNTPHYAADYKDGMRAQAELDRMSAEQARVREAREQLIAALRAGRVTLAAAADGYYQMLLDCPWLLTGLRLTFPHADSDRERAALRLIADAPADAALTDRLTAEYRREFTPASAAPAPLPPSPRPGG